MVTGNRVGQDSPGRVSPVGASHFFPEYLVSTVLSLSRDHVSARLCPPPGMWAGTAPGGRGREWVREASLAPLSHPTLLSLTPQPHTKLISRCHVCGGLSLSPSSRQDQALGTLGASPVQCEPNSVRATSDVSPEHLGPCRSSTLCPRSTPPSSLHLYPSQSDLPLPSSDSAGPLSKSPHRAGLSDWPGAPRDGGSTWRQGLLRLCCVCLQVSLPGETL